MELNYIKDNRGSRRKSTKIDKTSDDAPKREGMRQGMTEYPHSGVSYRQIRRFLKAHVGQKWDSVYSRISHFNDYRVKETITWLVDRNYADFYVDEDGILRYKEYSFKYRPKKKTFFFQSGKDILFKHEGIWYVVTLGVIPKEGHFKDVFLGTPYRYQRVFGGSDLWDEHWWARVDLYGNSSIYCLTKKSANKKTIQNISGPFDLKKVLKGE